MRREVRLAVVTVTIVASAMVLVVLALLALDRVVPQPRVPEPSEITTPLDPSVVRDVCSSLGLGDDCPQCRPGAVVYAPDFFPAIRRAFREGRATWQEVDSRLGAYRYDCEDPVEVRRLRATLIRCKYDLRGDHVYPFAFTFTDSGVLYAITFGGPGS